MITIVTPVKYIKAASLFCSSDNGRTALHNIRFEATDGGGIFVATNGHAIIFIKTDVVADGLDVGKHVLLPVPRLSNLGLSVKDTLTIKIDNNEKAKTVHYNGNHYMRQVVMQGYDAYPNVWDLIPKTEKTMSGTVGLNAAYLYSYRKALALVEEGRESAIYQTFYDSDGKQPILITFHCTQDMFGLLMPCVGTGVGYVPEWAKKRMQK